MTERVSLGLLIRIEGHPDAASVPILTGEVRRLRGLILSVVTNADQALVKAGGPDGPVDDALIEGMHPFWEEADLIRRETEA